MIPGVVLRALSGVMGTVLLIGVLLQVGDVMRRMPPLESIRRGIFMLPFPQQMLPKALCQFCAEHVTAGRARGQHGRVRA